MKIAKPIFPQAGRWTRRIRPALTVALAGIAVLSLAATAVAETGTFRMILAGQHDYTTFGFVDQTITGGAIEGTSTIIESSGDPFVVDEHGRVTCMVYAKQDEAGLELEAPCFTTNAAGEKLFSLAQRTLGDVGGAGQGGEGRWQLLGGSGKFADVTGSCSYEIEYLADNWLVAMPECEWERP